MSLMIRLTRIGKKGEAKYRIIVKEKRDRRDGKAMEILGWYEKKATSEKKQIDMKRLQYWKSVGAQLSPTVQKLIK